MFLISFVQAYPQWARTMVVGGAATCVASLFLSSFATKVQGVFQRQIFQGTNEEGIIGLAADYLARCPIWYWWRVDLYACYGLGK